MQGHVVFFSARGKLILNMLHYCCSLKVTQKATYMFDDCSLFSHIILLSLCHWQLTAYNVQLFLLEDITCNWVCHFFTSTLTTSFRDWLQPMATIHPKLSSNAWQHSQLEFKFEWLLMKRQNESNECSTHASSPVLSSPPLWLCHILGPIINALRGLMSERVGDDGGGTGGERWV